MLLGLAAEEYVSTNILVFHQAGGIDDFGQPGFICVNKDPDLPVSHFLLPSSSCLAHANFFAQCCSLFWLFLPLLVPVPSPSPHIGIILALG